MKKERSKDGLQVARYSGEEKSFPPGSDDFLVASYGRDKTTESWTYNASTPDSGLYSISTTADFDKDVINFNGAFIRGPRSGATGS